MKKLKIPLHDFRLPYSQVLARIQHLHRVRIVFVQSMSPIVSFGDHTHGSTIKAKDIIFFLEMFGTSWKTIALELSFLMARAIDNHLNKQGWRESFITLFHGQREK